MPIGVIVNCLAVLTGGVIGGICGNKIPERLKTDLTLIFGICAMGMGINSVILLENQPAVIFAVIVGTAVGLLLHLGDHINGLLGKLEKPLGNIMKIDTAKTTKEEYMNAFITVLVLFCASANGIYGSLDAGFSGDHTILISKSILDLFTAMIFSCNLGIMVSLICVPQFVIFTLIFCLARVIYPLTTPVMINDFKGCGGFLLLATGLRLMKVKNFPLPDMIPALVLVMPISWLWTNCIVPLLS